MIRIDKMENGNKIRMGHKAYVIDGNVVTRSNGEPVTGKEATSAKAYYDNALKLNAAEAKEKATPKAAKAKGKTAKNAKAKTAKAPKEAKEENKEVVAA